MTNIYFCGYSYHTQSYYSKHKSGFPGYLFRLQTEGSCQIIVKERTLDIKKGDLLLIPPGEPYEIIVQENHQSGDYHLLCEGEWIDNWWNRVKKPTYSKIDLDEKLLSLWRFLIVEERRPSSEEDKELSEHLLPALCLYLERLINETYTSKSRPYAVTRMMRYIEEHATSAFKVEDVARHVDLSVSRAAHLFKSTVGKTMIEYALEIRMSAAIDRMKYTSMTLEQIAEDCGFGAYPYFHKLFKKKYGIPPSSYRNRE